MRIWLHGNSGRMGLSLRKIIAEKIYDENFKYVGGSSSKGNFDAEENKIPFAATKPDLIIDFSTPQGNSSLWKSIHRRQTCNIKILVATTGLSSELTDKWKSLSNTQQLAVLFAPNTSLGISLMLRMALQTVGILNRSHTNNTEGDARYDI